MSEYKYYNDYEREWTQKYEGTYTHEEVELNKRLYEECLKPEVDFATVEELLKQGADPLGGTAEYGWNMLLHPFGELILDSNENPNIPLPQLTELFLRYGMDIDSPRIPYDYDNSLHVLTFMPENEKTLLTLKILLDHGLSVDSFAEFWGHFMFDEINVHHIDPNADQWNTRFVYGFKMIMLGASYDHIDDEALNRHICRKYNNYDIRNFRDWDRYEYRFDTSHSKHRELYGTLVSIYDKDSGELVWKMGIGKPGKQILLDEIERDRIFETDRLTLRPWREDDDYALYKCASDPDVGTPAGWEPHSDREYSLNIIRTVFNAPEIYAVCLKDEASPIGCVGLHRNDIAEDDDEYELGYWLGKPYWGQEIIPEAAKELLRHAFLDLHVNRIWCGRYEGNEKSRRVIEKLGFKYHHTTEGLEVLGEIRTGHVYLMTREEWQSLYEC